MKKWLVRGLVAFLMLVVGVAIYLYTLHQPLPAGVSGPEADALAKRIEHSIEADAWRDIESVYWVFGGRQEHLWDKRRGLIRVRFGNHEVLRALDGAGIARTDGKDVDGAAKTELLDQASTHWANDAFWLNPLTKLFDPGVTRSIARNADGEEGLLVTYGQGGVTPGDSYLWLVDANDRPKAWQMWVGIIPIGGLRASWEGWINAGGAQVSTAHKISFITLELTDVAAGPLSEVEPGPDPFAALFEAE